MLYDFHPKLLAFMYELTKLKHFETVHGISKKISIEYKNKKIKLTPKTIQKWFNLLSQKIEFHGKQLVKFSYFPTFFYEKFGLRRVFFFHEINSNITKFLNNVWIDYACWLYDVQKLKYVLMTAHLLPKTLNAKELSNNYIETFKGFFFCSPLHKIIDASGYFCPEKNDEEIITDKCKEFEEFVRNLPKIEINHYIRYNPLIIPVVFEYTKECFSSRKVWFELKSKLGSSVWQYIRKKKKESDWVGIKKVQQALADIYAANIFHQVKIEYLPLEKTNFCVYGLCKKTCIKEIMLNSVVATFYPLRKQDKLFFVSLTNNEGLTNIFNCKLTSLFFLDHAKSIELMLATYKFDYRLFDPVRCRWAVKNKNKKIKK